MKNKILATVLLLIFLIIIPVIYYYKFSAEPELKLDMKDMSSILEINPERDYGPAILVNLDNDDENELFVSVIENSNLFYKRLQGKLVPLEMDELEDRDSSTVSLTPCDLDQDGTDEILLINEFTRSRIMKNIKGDWTDLLKDEDKDIIDKLAHAHAATCIDRKGDGKYGLVVVSENGPLLYLEMKDKRINDVAASIGLNKSSEGRSVLGIPAKSGRSNIMVGNIKRNYYFVNNSDGTFTERTAVFKHHEIKLQTNGISLIDFNNDELMDIVYGNEKGNLKILEQEESGNFIESTPHNLSNNHVVNTVLVEDFNLDGYEDIYLNNVRSENSLFLGLGKKWKRIPLGHFSEDKMYGISSLAADLDDNGSFEILNTHGDGKAFPLTVYSFKPEGNWLKIKLRFKNGGIPRGAVVHIKTSGLDHTKSISSGSGRYANYDDELIFGFRKDEKIESAEIITPSGREIIEGDKLKLFQTNFFSVQSYNKELGARKVSLKPKL